METTTTTTETTATPPTTTATPATEPEVVPRNEFEFLKKESDKARARLQQLEDENKNLRTEKLKTQNDWQKIAEMKDEELKNLNTKYENLSMGVRTSTVMSVIKQEALKAGILPAALEDLEMMKWEDEVQLETTSTGRVNVLGAKTAVERLKTLKPYWFQNNKAPNVNMNGPGVVPGPNDSGAVSWEDVKKAEETAKKTGDYVTYKNLIMKYKNQTR